MFSRFNRLWKSPDLHQRHAEGVPAIEKRGIKRHTLPILLDRAFQFTDRKIAIRVVEDLVQRHHEREVSGLRKLTGRDLNSGIVPALA